jgi:tetratricopeptide (TPR) repeat protein
LTGHIDDKWVQLVRRRGVVHPEAVGDLVRLLASAGRVEEAREVGEVALQAGLDGLTEAALLLGLAEALKHAGHSDAVVEYTQQALCRPGLPDTLRTKLLEVRSHGLLYIGDSIGADRAAQEAALLGHSSGKPIAEVYRIIPRSAIARDGGHLDEAIAYARKAVRVSDEVGGEARTWHPRLWLGRALAAADRFEEAAYPYCEGQREAEMLGAGWSQPLWQLGRSELHFAAGRLDEAAAEAGAGLRAGEHSGPARLCVPLYALLAQVAIKQGDFEVVPDRLDRT